MALGTLSFVVVPCLLIQVVAWFDLLGCVVREKPTHIRLMHPVLSDLLIVPLCVLIGFACALGEARRRKFLRSGFCLALGALPTAVHVLSMWFLLRVCGVVLSP